MIAPSLFGVLLVARALVLALDLLPWNVWLVPAFLWQDLLFVLVFALFERLMRRWIWVAWGFYVLIVAYVAVNVALAAVLSTYLTWPILNATSGTLSDSIWYHVTPGNLLRVATLLAVAAAQPILMRRLPPPPLRLRLVGGGVFLAVLLGGPFAVARCETLGLHRNVFVTLLVTALPRVNAWESNADWGKPPLGSPPGEDHSALRGTARGRNVVVIHLESTGAQYLGIHGAATDPMPNLTRLSRQSLIFDNAYSSYPETVKSFLAVHNSLYAALDTPSSKYRQVATPALAEVLRQRGYRTGLFHSGRFGYLDMTAVLHERGFDTLEDAGDIGGERDSSFGIDEESAVRRILAWIDQTPRDQPFFVTYLPIAGHHPYTTPDSLQDRLPFPREGNENRYRNALFYADCALGQLLDGLRARGLEESTLFVLCGDHGQAFDQHRGNIGHTLFLYEENVHVPLLFAMPGRAAQSHHVKRTASLVDVTPTVLDLLGIEANPGYQGRSLLSGPQRLALFCTDYGLAYAGLRDGPWKFIHEFDSDRDRLYYLPDDPGEQHDVSAAHLQRVTAYRGHVEGWTRSQKEKSH